LTVDVTTEAGSVLGVFGSCEKTHLERWGSTEGEVVAEHRVIELHLSSALCWIGRGGFGSFEGRAAAILLDLAQLVDGAEVGTL